MILHDPDVYIASNLDQGEDGVWHVTIRTRASTAERAKQAAAELAAVYASGRETWWRRKPEGASQIEVSGEEKIRGYARFSFALRDGPEHEPEEYSCEVRYLSLKELSDDTSQRGFGT